MHSLAGSAARLAAIAHTTRSDPGILVARNLTYSLGGKRLVDDVSLTLRPGGLTVIMGPNGAGKSLLLRLLHGLIAPTSGSVTCGGASIGDETRKTQAMVFQKPVLLRRSVAANLDYVLDRRDPSRLQRRDDLLDLVGLSALAHQPARLLSGGEQQRLAVARALATGPGILLLDEPTANLDPASVQVIERIVLDASRAGTKVLFVTHDIGQARRLAGDVVFLHRGRLVEHASADRFFENPHSSAAEAFLRGDIVL
jgi:tungstate transport system ATP-binding protein